DDNFRTLPSRHELMQWRPRWLRVGRRRRSAAREMQRAREEPRPGLTTWNSKEGFTEIPVRVKFQLTRFLSRRISSAGEREHWRLFRRGWARVFAASGRSAVWQRAWFGTMRSEVQILSPRLLLTGPF